VDIEITLFIKEHKHKINQREKTNRVIQTYEKTLLNLTPKPEVNELSKTT
jgi:hypothetical protein